MDERNPDNLELLYHHFSQDAIDGILPGDSFSVDGVEFVCQYLTGSTAERFYIVKSLPLIDRYREVCERFRGANIVELGIAEGGSTALIALLARPHKLVAIDLEPVSLAALTEFSERHGLSDVVQTFYGIDQSDRAGLGAAVDAGLDGNRIDLVIDDCSHHYEPTRASFECLFPRLRPGGLYLIEDWNADHVFRDALVDGLNDPATPNREQLVADFRRAMTETNPDESTAPRQPLTRLAIELAVARCSMTDAIASVTLDEFWIVVERGEAELEPDAFLLDRVCRDHFGFLPAAG